MIILFRKIALFLSLLFIFPVTVYGADNSASSAVVLDADTGIILYEKNAYENRSMASTTKIMTCLLAIESGKLDKKVKITKEMLQTEGSSLGLRAGDTITLIDLITGMMLTSGNDSANAVAFYLSGSIENFAQLMNTRASQIGMKSTVFVTPSGLDEGEHHSTAYDMALLAAQAVMVDTFCDIVSKKSAVIKINDEELTVYNHNKLLNIDENYFGIKTGYTQKAGRCLVSAKKYNGNKLICVTLNAPDDWNDHISLYKECEKRYNKVEVKESLQLNVVGGDKDTIKCSFSKTYYLLDSIELKIYIKPFDYAPVSKGSKVGDVYVYYNKKLLERLPIEADEDVKYYAEQERSTTAEIHG